MSDIRRKVLRFGDFGGVVEGPAPPSGSPVSPRVTPQGGKNLPGAASASSSASTSTKPHYPPSLAAKSSSNKALILGAPNKRDGGITLGEPNDFNFRVKTKETSDGKKKIIGFIHAITGEEYPLPEEIARSKWKPTERGRHKQVTHRDPEDKNEPGRQRYVGLTMVTGSVHPEQARYERELLAAINCPLFVPQIAVNPKFLISPEMKSGCDLTTYINKGHLLNLSEFSDLLNAMKKTHDLGIIIGDIKPENMPMNDRTIFLVDFETMVYMKDVKDRYKRKIYSPDISPQYAPQHLRTAAETARKIGPDCLLDEISTYGKVNDDHAMLLTLMVATDIIGMPDDPGKLSPEIHQQREGWIEYNGRDKYKDALRLLVKDTHQYYEKYKNTLHLADMLRMQRPSTFTNLVALNKREDVEEGTELFGNLGKDESAELYFGKSQEVSGNEQLDRRKLAVTAVKDALESIIGTCRLHTASESFNTVKHLQKCLLDGYEEGRTLTKEGLEQIVNIMIDILHKED